MTTYLLENFFSLLYPKEIFDREINIVRKTCTKINNQDFFLLVAIYFYETENNQQRGRELLPFQSKRERNISHDLLKN